MATREQLSAKRIDSLISEVSSTVGSFNEKVQETAIAIISHAETYGDCSRAKVLARAVPSRLRNMLIGWFALYSPIGVTMGKTATDDKCRFNKEESVTAFRKRSRVLGAESFPLFHLDGARSNSWFNDPAKVAPEPKPLNTLGDAWNDINKFFDRLIKQAELDDEKAKFAPDDRPVVLDMAKELKAVVDRFHNRQLAKLAEHREGGEGEDEQGAGEETPTNVVKAPKPRRQAATAQKKAASVH